MKKWTYHSKDAANWISSDLHLGHQQPFIWQKRGFTSVKEHDDFIINKLNELVKPQDNLFHLGDFCLNTPEEGFESYIQRINCQNIHVIWGNHPNPMYKVYKRAVADEFDREDIEVYPFIYKNLIFLGSHFECFIDYKHVVMNHYPLAIWDKMKDGSYMLCGHSHYSYPETQATAKDGLILDCGWDGHNKPLLFNEVVQIMNTKRIRGVDHHVNKPEVKPNEFF